MGMEPKTKADCDRLIAREEGLLAQKKRVYEEMKGAGSGYSKSTLAAQKASIETTKGEIAKLKAIRRTLK